MATNRLFLILYYLLEKGSSTAPELAEHFEVSVRTIYRDIDMLSAAGIPVYAAQGKGGGIFIQENYVLDKSLVSDQEQNQILMALQGMGMLNDENTNTALAKLSGIFQKQNVNWIEVDYSDWNRGSSDIFHTLKQAIFCRNKVAFTYYGTAGSEKDRIVEPLKLVFRSREWYLYAYCCLRNSCRLFKLTRIRELTILDENFIRFAPIRVFEVEEASEQKEPYVALTLLFEPGMRHRVYEHFDQITEQENGGLQAEVSLPQNEWLYSFLLSFGSTVEVLSPQEIREEIQKRIKNMGEKYRT